MTATSAASENSHCTQRFISDQLQLKEQNRSDPSQIQLHLEQRRFKVCGEETNFPQKYLFSYPCSLNKMKTMIKTATLTQDCIPKYIYWHNLTVLCLFVWVFREIHFCNLNLITLLKQIWWILVQPGSVRCKYICRKLSLLCVFKKKSNETKIQLWTKADHSS